LRRADFSRYSIRALNNPTELRLKATQIGEVIRTTVPQEMWAEIVSKLNDYEQPLCDVTDDLDEACDPDDFEDIDGEF